MLVSTSDAPVRIIDRPCGSGKTTNLLRSFQPDRRYLVVVPLLTEVTRVINEACVPFTEPDDGEDYGNKRDSLEGLLRRKQNVVTTHALFENISAFARAGLLNDYDIIIDEVPNVLATVGDISRQSLDDIYVNAGYVTIEDDGRIVPTQKWREDHELVSDTLSERVYQLASSGMLYVVNRTFLLWTLPRELLTAGRSLTILTYLAEGSLLLPYLRKLGISYVHDVDVEADLEHRRRAAELIEVRDMPRLKDVKLSYTGQTKSGPSVTSKVSGALLGLRRGDLKDAPLKDVLVTCAKSSWYEGGKDLKDVKRPEAGPFAKGTKLFSDVKWIPNTTRGTNDHAHASHLIYLYDQFPNPAYLTFLGCPGNKELQERYALAELVQVIYRTRVRKGEKIVVYVPSQRMRRLLTGYLDAVDLCLPQSLAA